jgi:adenylate kinase
MIIILGVAGSGKSTQGNFLAERAGYMWLSIGALLREKITDERREAMLEGKMLDDNEVISFLDEKLKSLPEEPEVVLDGFPRSAMQAEWLISQVGAGKLKISSVIHLVLSKDEAKQRLLNRGRQDDHEEAIDERFKEYEETIIPIIAILKNSGVKVIEVSADGSEEVIYNLIDKALGGDNV